MQTASLATEQICIDVIRGLSMDAVQKANSGHPGMPMGAAPMAHVLWTRHLRHSPSNPEWYGRDRFILSAGHGSMLLYSLLHLTGYDLPLEEIKNFRQWESRTPGHPENFMTPGVEMCTGPLGQGFATAIGFALAERYAAAVVNTAQHRVIDHFTYVIASDGDLMEGVTQEAASLAGHLQLGKLVVLYDDNEISIDGSTEITFTEDTSAKFRAMGWHVQEVDGNELDAIDKAIANAKDESSKPSLIICRTVIGYGSPNKSGKSSSHGSPLGEEEVKLAKENLGLPVDEKFFVPTEVRDYYRKAVEAGKELESAWQDRVDRLGSESPDKARIFSQLVSGEVSDDWYRNLDDFTNDQATREQSETIINAIAASTPWIVGGSADLASSVKTEIKGSPLNQASQPDGRNIAFGVREHAMMAAVNGLNLSNVRAFGGTFLIFSDYCRPSIRLAALMRTGSIFLFSHDSIGLGEDGPTHQPIEHVMSLRAIPNLNVMRPADGNETAVCWNEALKSTTTPSAIMLTRHKVPCITPKLENHPASKGAYVLVDSASPKLCIAATGSEVSVAVEAAKQLEAEGISTRVVSMPSWFIFERQSASYKEEVFPKGVPVLSVEAGTTLGWERYADASVGIDRFGASAPGPELFEKFGFTPENVVLKAKSLIQ